MSNVSASTNIYARIVQQREHRIYDEQSQKQQQVSKQTRVVFPEMKRNNTLMNTTKRYSNKQQKTCGSTKETI